MRKRPVMSDALVRQANAVVDHDRRVFYVNSESSEAQIDELLAEAGIDASVELPRVVDLIDAHRRADEK